MSFYLRKVSIALLANLLMVVTTIHAQVWVRGAVAVVSVKGEVVFEEIGGDALHMDSADSVPRYLSGFLKVRTQIGDSVFLRTSNRISIYNQGVGDLTIERFEQDVSSSMKDGKSRMILNLREGVLAVDNRALSADSQMIVETPIGRISVKHGWWLLKITYDSRIQSYDLVVECADGVLRFTDLNDVTYTMRSRQRLSGHGASSRLSIQVSEISDRANSLFEEFSAMEQRVTPLQLSTEGYRAKMRAIEIMDVKETVVSEPVEGAELVRPLVIEYAPQSRPVTPFRAVIRAPSSFQADLF